MDRREMLGVLGATAAGLTAAGGSAAVAQHHEDDIHEKCAAACVTCAKACNQGFHHCYKMVLEGQKEHAKSMHILVDCGDICATAGKLVARMSPLMVHTCAACGDSCDDTLKVVEPLHKGHTGEMHAVIETLQKCRDSCREMVKKMGGHSATRG
jgi:hypothetical protein